MADQSQLIRFCVRQKSCFSGSFLQKIASHGQSVDFRLCSVIHHWKALLKKYFIYPAKRQIFRDASGQIFSLILRPCHMLYYCLIIFAIVIVLVFVFVFLFLKGF